MDALSLIIGLVLGAAVGSALAFLALRARQTAAQAAEHAAAELARTESASLKQELAQSRERASTAEQAHAGTKATLAAVTLRAQELATAAKAERDRADTEAAARATLQADFSALHTKLNERERNLREQAELLTRAQDQLKATFEATGAKVLQASAEQLLKQAREQFEGQKKLSEQDLAARQQAIDATLKPLQEQLAKQEALVTALGEKREGDAKALTEQLRQISELQQAASTAAQRLSSALSDNRQRGRWGEVALRQVVEMAGLQAGIHFDEQAHVESEDGRLRPDMIVKLPSGRKIPVDSKVPLPAYLRSIDDSASPEVRAQSRIEHASAVRAHVRALANRAYAQAIPGEIEFVILFIPVESAFTAAFEADPNLHAEALRSKVLIVTPSTLLAVLRTVAMHWSSTEMAQNVRSIQDQGKKLYDRLQKFASLLADVGKRLQKSTDSYNKAVGSFNHMLLPAANKIAGMIAADPVDQLDDLTTVPRQPSLPDAIHPPRDTAGGEDVPPTQPDGPRGDDPQRPGEDPEGPQET